jgi:hypothetical protein
MKPVFYRLLHLRRRTFEMVKTVDSGIAAKITPKYDLIGSAVMQIPEQNVEVTRYNASNNLVMPTVAPIHELSLTLERVDINYKEREKHEIFIEEEGEEIKYNLAEYIQKLDEQFLDKTGKVWKFPVTSTVRSNQISFKLAAEAAQFIDLAGLSNDTPAEERPLKKRPATYVRGSIKLHKRAS